MERKLKICSGCNRPKVIWKRIKGDPFCQSCSFSTGVAMKPGKSKPKEKQKGISSKSSKQAKLDVAYNALRLVFLKDHSMCNAHLPGCTLKTTDVHHKKGRGEYLLDTTTWLPVCRHCHDWIEKHPEEAITLGFSELRLETKNMISVLEQKDLDMEYMHWAVLPTLKH